MSKRTTLRRILSGQTFRIVDSGATYTATSGAQACGRGYVRVETSTPSRERDGNHVVNLHGTTDVELVGG